MSKEVETITVQETQTDVDGNIVKMERMTERVVEVFARERMAAQMVRGYRTDMDIGREGDRVRTLLWNAKRELEKMVQRGMDVDLRNVMGEALKAIEEAKGAVDKVIGVGMSVQIDERTGFRSSERTAAPGMTGKGLS